MRTEDPVQFGVKRIAMVFRGDFTPTPLEVETQTEELAEVIGKVRRRALSLQSRILDHCRVVETHASVFAPVELPLRENAHSLRALHNAVLTG